MSLKTGVIQSYDLGGFSAIRFFAVLSRVFGRQALEVKPCKKR